VPFPPPRAHAFQAKRPRKLRRSPRFPTPTGQPLNVQLVERKANLIETTRTASGYRLYALADTSPPKPGLIFDGSGAGAIEVEIWGMDEASFGSFVAAISKPLGIGTVTLADGRSVKSFLC
jgi:allophanate hydrolase